MVLLEVGLERLVVGGLLATDRTGVDKVRDGGNLGVSLLGCADDRVDSQAGRQTGNAGAANREEVAACYFLRHVHLSPTRSFAWMTTLNNLGAHGRGRHSPRG